MAKSSVNEHAIKSVEKVRIRRDGPLFIMETHTVDGHVHVLRMTQRETERVWLVLAKHLDHEHKAQTQLRIEED